MVAIPEGLALAASISMALSIENLRKDKIEIKNLHAIQKIGMIHDILIGITGTLTEGKLSVAKWHFFDDREAHKNESEDYFDRGFEMNTEAK